MCGKALECFEKLIHGVRVVLDGHLADIRELVVFIGHQEDP